MRTATIDDRRQQRNPTVLIIIDNYDSFTHNLAQAFGAIGLEIPALHHDIAVIRNDAASVDELSARNPTHLVISPGPCTPREGGISNDAIRRFTGHVPILGVCLGHQCIGDVFGATVTRARHILHGKTSPILHDGRTLFANVPNPFPAMRYHSLALERDSIDDAFEVSAWTDDGEVMAIRHRTAPLEGVQFHPESFLTTDGTRFLRNFLWM